MLDEYEKTGLNLTEDQKEKLVAIGITSQMLSCMKTDMELLDAISKKWHELVDNQSIINKKKSKPWNKKHFWD